MSDSQEYRGGFRVCPFGCIVAADRTRTHERMHAERADAEAQYDAILSRVLELEQTEAVLDVREWPEHEPEDAPTEPVAVPAHDPELEPMHPGPEQPSDDLRDFARF